MHCTIWFPILSILLRSERRLNLISLKAGLCLHLKKCTNSIPFSRNLSAIIHRVQVTSISSPEETNVVGLSRMALKPYRFSNGTVIPEGTMVGVPAGAIYMDDSIYERADEFDGFRFSRLRDEVGDLPKFRSVDANNEYLHFGSGPHAW